VCASCVTWSTIHLCNTISWTGTLVANFLYTITMYKWVGHCYDSNISLTYCGCPVGLRMSNSMQWMRHFALSDTLCPTQLSVPMFSFLLQLKYFSDTADIQLCAMAMVFFHYRTTCAQFGQVFRCFPFITFHLSFFQIYFHSYLAYLISDISWGTCI
jgi:hypothetical protein